MPKPRVRGMLCMPSRWGLTIRCRTGWEACSRIGPEILRLTPTGLGEQPERRHDQCCRQESDQPCHSEPVAAPSTPAATDQPATEARTDVGNNSLTSAPAAGAKTEAANTPRM